VWYHRCLIAGTSLVVACAHQVPVNDDLASRPYEAVELVASPFFPQDKYQCGPAALATVLNHAGIPVTPDELVPRVYLPERRGSLQPELVATARHYDRLPYVIDPSVSAIIEELNAGHPVLVLQNLGWEHYPVWHYAVVIGYDPKSGDFILRSGKTKRLTLDADRFAATWSASNNWGVVILQPGRLPANPDADRYLASVAALEEVGRFKSAGQAYAVAVDRWPDNAIAWLGLGNSRYHTGAFVEAESAYRRALALDESNPFAQNNLALALAQRGCYLQAKSVVDKAIRSVRDPATLEMLNDTKREITDYPGADEGRCYQTPRR
jgi:hypothetical protein